MSVKLQEGDRVEFQHTYAECREDIGEVGFAFHVALLAIQALQSCKERLAK